MLKKFLDLKEDGKDHEKLGSIREATVAGQASCGLGLSTRPEPQSEPDNESSCVALAHPVTPVAFVRCSQLQNERVRPPFSLKMI